LKTSCLAACERGGTLVEFALIAPLFLGLLLGAMQEGTAGMVATSFENAVTQAGRHIRTGQASGTSDMTAFKQLICDQMIDTQSTCLSRLHVDVRPLSGFAAGVTAQAKVDQSKDSFNKGGAGSIILLTASYDWPMFTPFLGDGFTRAGSTSVRISSHLLFKNEPYQ
jgi:Flp pilus assembly protein TadG